MSEQATGTLGACLLSARVGCAICETGVAECSLDNPTPPSKPLARLHAVARDTRCAAPTALPSPMGSRSVRSIGMQLSWMFAGTACQPLTAGIDSTNRIRKRASCPARPRSGSLEKPALIYQQVVFAAEFAPISWISACVLAPPAGAAMLQRQCRLDPI